LTRPNGRHFQDQHLFQHLPEAFVALCQSVRAFAPDVLLTHAYEGGHIDHDACSFLAAQAATILGVERLEFPLYWQTSDRRDMFQQFCDHRPGEFALQLSPQELAMKRHMFDAYRSQEKILSVFHSDTDSFRPATGEKYDQLPGWPDYPFENRRKRLKAEIFVQKLVEFRREAVAT
jgi:LmbE family N-acetylglucosaminyl deacetylase